MDTKQVPSTARYDFEPFLRCLGSSQPKSVKIDLIYDPKNIRKTAKVSEWSNSRKNHISRVKFKDL